MGPPPGTTTAMCRRPSASEAASTAAADLIGHQGVAHHPGHGEPLVRQGGGGVTELLLGTSGQGDLRPVPRQEPGRSEADPTATADHDGSLPTQNPFHCTPDSAITPGPATAQELGWGPGGSHAAPSGESPSRRPALRRHGRATSEYRRHRNEGGRNHPRDHAVGCSSPKGPSPWVTDPYWSSRSKGKT